MQTANVADRSRLYPANDLQAGDTDQPPTTGHPLATATRMPKRYLTAITLTVSRNKIFITVF